MKKRFTTPVDPVLRIPDVAVDSPFLVERGIQTFNNFSLDRIEWMRRREKYYLNWDDYTSPIRKGLWDGACFLPGTDLLTKRGWIPVERVTTDDFVFSRNPKNGNLDFIPVELTHSFETSNYGVRFYNAQGLDITVTDKHRMYVVDERCGVYPNRHSFIEAHEFLNDGRKKLKHWGIPRNGKYSEGITPPIPVDIDEGDWFELWGWYLSEGSSCASNETQIEISQSITGNPDKYERIKNLLQRLPFKFHAGENGHYFRLSLPHELRKKFKSVGRQEVRFIPRELLEAPSELLKRMLESMLLGDGHENIKKGIPGKHWNYATSSYQLSCDVQELLVKIGLWGSVYKIKTNQGKNFYLVSVRINDRTADFYCEKIDYVGPNYCVTTEWGVVYARMNGHPLFIGQSNLHLPLTEIQASIMHALIMQANFFNYPWFYIDPQEEVDLARLQKAERFMKYILERYCNFNKGIYLTMDDWAWDLTTEGVGILSRSWKTVQRRFITVERNRAFESQRFDLQKMLEDTEEKEFDRLAKKMIETPYMEKAVIRTVFDGPVVIAENPAYILFKGDVVDSTDLNEHETIAKVIYMNRDDLLRHSDSEYFDEAVVEEILESEPDRYASSESVWGANRIKRAQDDQTGVNTINPNAKEDQWEILCLYDTTTLDPKSKNKALSDRIQYFIHPKSRKLLRWTYLDRISGNGKIPLHMAHLYRRPRRSTGRGMVQTMYTLNEAQDLLINQTIDSGLLANNPMFGFRGGSSFDPDEVRAEPGLGIKMDDPNTDLRFFTWNVNPNWSLPIQGVISSFAQQLTSIGPQAAGQVGPNVGALRSASGVQELGRNASTQQNIIINRSKICISELFEGLFGDCTERMDQRIKISITGADGTPLYDDDGKPLSDDLTPSELRMRVHFGIYANAMNMNPQARREAAAAIAQFSFQPLPIKSNVITPQNVYEILLNVHQSLGTLRPERFLSKPGPGTALPIDVEIRMIMQGLMPPIVVNDLEHQKKIDIFTPLLQSDKAKLEIEHGIIHPSAMKVLEKAIEIHQELLGALEKPSNVQNPFGSNQSPTMGMQGEGEGIEPAEPELPRGEVTREVSAPEGGGMTGPGGK